MSTSTRGFPLTVRLFIVGTLVTAIALIMYSKRDVSVSGAQLPEDPSSQGVASTPAESGAEPVKTASVLPRLVDLGAKKCVPCKMMAPILEQLRKDFVGSLQVEFIDVWENPKAAEEHGVEIIPTQIFYDATGAERFRHEGFFSRDDILAKWKELGIEFGGRPPAAPEFSRLEPAQADTRPGEKICYLCDGDIGEKTRVTYSTEKGDVFLCSPHCLFITLTSLEDRPALDRMKVTDWPSSGAVEATAAFYLCGADISGRPTVKAFREMASAELERQSAGGLILEWTALEAKELAVRCGFCDRAVYPEDATEVIVQGLHTWGCCTMCALGVAARLQKDIEVHAKDALTGEAITVATLDGKIGALEPATSVAWAGMKLDADGKLSSTGCFKQAFFVDEDHLKEWVGQHPLATGKAITIAGALEAKMKLSPDQIKKACKIGECAPRS